MNLPVVSIVCTAYNHELYIKNTFEGFISQKTTFPIEIIVHDDASTDNTADIIRHYETKYPELIFPIYQSENQYSKVNVNIWSDITFPLARGKYIAICEGDDYWTDPYKLQKQVDFLEAKPDYGLVFTDADHLYQKTEKIINSYDKTFYRKIPVGDVFDALLYGNPYKTCTSMFKKELLNDLLYPFMKDQNFRMGDKVLWLHIAAKAKIGYINDSTSVYRILEKSASNFDNIPEHILFIKDSGKLSLFFAHYYNHQIDNKKLERTLAKTIIMKSIVNNQYKFLANYIDKPFLIIKIFIKEKLIRRILKAI